MYDPIAVVVPLVETNRSIHSTKWVRPDIITKEPFVIYHPRTHERTCPLSSQNNERERKRGESRSIFSLYERM